MWIKSTTYPVMRGEPQLGTIIEQEVMEEPGEGLEALISYMVQVQEVPDMFTVIDYTTEDDIELYTSKYLDSKTIDMLNGMFIESNDWTEEQLSYIIENLSTKCYGSIE